MRRINLLSLLLLVGATVAMAQSPDTIIYAQGKIISGITKEPVSASISYQSLPYGSKVGILSGTEFLFPLFDNEKYSIVVEAPGFSSAKYMLDPATANSERRVIQNIELGLPTSATKEIETSNTHHVGKVMRLENLIFQVGNARITPASYPELDQVAKMLHENTNMIIQLEGHTDFKGDPKENMKLSERRVEAVRDYLISKGVAKHKVKTKAFGGTQPLSRENSEEAHKMNRRVEARVLQN